jgi:hypothetical protein
VKAVLAYIFIIIFSTQILPIKEIGEVLFKGQITEEEVHGYGGNTDDGKSKKGNDTFPCVPSAQNHSRISILSQKVSTAIHQAEKIPPHFVPEIITPPPNSFV